MRPARTHPARPAAHALSRLSSRPDQSMPTRPQRASVAAAVPAAPSAARLTARHRLVQALELLPGFGFELAYEGEVTSGVPVCHGTSPLFAGPERPGRRAVTSRGLSLLRSRQPGRIGCWAAVFPGARDPVRGWRAEGALQVAGLPRADDPPRRGCEAPISRARGRRRRCGLAPRGPAAPRGLAPQPAAPIASAPASH